MHPSDLSTDYSGAITALIGLGVLLTAMVVYILRRPSDLPARP